MNVIGIAGQLGNGKDVVADYLCDKLNEYVISRWIAEPPWKRDAFANKVKETFENAFGVDREFIEKWKRNPEAPPGFLKNIRQSLQFIGDGFRQIKDEIWIDIALRGNNKVISDSRYINEAKAIRAKGGCMILLYRPGFLNDDPNPSESQIRPVVEWCVNNLVEGPIPMNLDEPICFYDYFMINDGSIDDLYAKVDKFVDWYNEI